MKLVFNNSNSNESGKLHSPVNLNETICGGGGCYCCLCGDIYSNNFKCIFLLPSELIME